jgi:hypothetical protein
VSLGLTRSNARHGVNDCNEKRPHSAIGDKGVIEQMNGIRLQGSPDAYRARRSGPAASMVRTTVKSTMNYCYVSRSPLRLLANSH